MIKLGIKRPVTTLMLVAAIIIFAAACLPRIPVELYPNYELGEVSVITRLRGGIAATEVESNVTRPMESVFAEVNGLRELSSASRESESNIVMRFRPGVNLNFAVLDVREKLATIKYLLPKEVERPTIAKFQQSDSPIVIVALSSDKHSPEQLRQIAEDKVKEKLARVPGVANIEVGGGQERKILIDIDNGRLLSYNLPIMSVVDMINTSNISVTAGDVEKMGERFVVRAVGEYTKMSEIENMGIGVTKSGSIIRLKDIATVRDSFYEPTSFARLNVKPVVSLYMQKESAANTITVGRKTQEAVEALRQQFAGEFNITIVKNDAEYIQSAIDSLESSVFQGSLLVIGILFLFLNNWRTIGIISTTLPISLMLAVVMMYGAGLTFNVMTLSGLAMGLGNLMDNAILILLNLGYHEKRGKFQNIQDLVIKGTEELVMPILASTISTIIVFLPIVFLDAEIKRLYVPFGLAIALSLFASLLGTLTFVPPLCIRVKNAFKFDIPRWYKPVSKKYIRMLTAAMRNQRSVLAITAVLFALAAWVFITRDSEFIEPGQANTFRVGIQFPPGMRIEISNAIVKKIEQALTKYPMVDQVSSRVEKLHTFLEVKVTRDKKSCMDAFRKRFPEFSPAFMYYQESQETAGAEMLVDFYGYDYAILKQLAFAASGRISQTPGFTDVKIRMREDEPEINFVINQANLAHFGISTLYLANTLHNQIRGLVATYYRTEGKEIETIARLTPGTIATTQDIPFVRFVTPYGDIVALNQLGESSQVTTTQEIWHLNKKRFVQISANRNKLGLTTAAEKIKQTFKSISFPKDYTYKISGDYERTLKSRTDFSLAMALTVTLIYLTLASLFESYSQPFLIMLALPLSMIGVSFMLYTFKKSVSLGVWIGMMILGGTVVNASIILVEKINQVRDEGHELLRAIYVTCQERLRAVLMSSLNNIFGLIPLVISTDDAAEMWRSLGMTVMGGMISGTFLTLFVVPISYYIVETTVNQPGFWTVAYHLTRFAERRKATAERKALKPAIEPVLQPALAAGEPKRGIFMRFFSFINIFGRVYSLIKKLFAKKKPVAAPQETVSKELLIITPAQPATKPAPAAVAEPPLPIPIALEPVEAARPEAMPVEHVPEPKILPEQPKPELEKPQIAAIEKPEIKKPPKRGFFTYILEEFLGMKASRPAKVSAPAPEKPTTAEEVLKKQKHKHRAVIGQGMYEITEEPPDTKPARRGFFAYIKEEILGMAPRPKTNKRKKDKEQA